MTSSAAHPPARRWLGPAFTTALLIGIAALLLTRGDPAVTLGIFATRFLGIFIEAAPFLLLGTAVSGLLEVFVSREDIVRWLPRSRLAAPFVGAFMGFAFPVCECGVVPVARRLFTKGLPMPVGVAFLLAAPVMNPIVLVSTYIAFGFGPLLIARFAITAAVAILVGLVFALTARPEEVLLPASLAPITGGSGAKVTDRPRLGPGLIRAAQFSVDETFDMGRYLVIGALLAALMQMFVTQEQFIGIGSGPVVSVIVMQAIAFVLSVCSTVDAFLALAFTGTFTVGSISAFLTFGPMIDVKSTLMFLGVFRRRAVAYLILIPFLLTLLAGVWLNLLLR
ncbi:MAG: permease [Anaerolineae bacterium]|nr:permease [Anaerolineae bacterium]